MAISDIRNALSSGFALGSKFGTPSLRSQNESFGQALKIDGRGAADAVVEAPGKKVSEPARERSRDARQDEQPIKTYDESARVKISSDAVKPTPSRGSRIDADRQPPVDADKPNFELAGTFKGNTLIFDGRGAAFEFGDNGEVTSYIATDDGIVQNGQGTIGDDGRISVTFTNGQVYSGQLNRDGDRAVINDIKFERQNPVFTGVTDGKNIAFDGISLEQTGDGQYAVTINTPDGQVINGSLQRDKNGDFVAKLDNGQTYAGNLSIDGKEVKLTNLELIENNVKAPQPKPAPTDAKPVGPVASDAKLSAQELASEEKAALYRGTLDLEV